MVATLRGADLVGLTYEPLYEPADWGVEVTAFVDGRLTRFPSAAEAPPRRVVATDFVSMEDGTGIVHIAPAFGGEDYETGKREGLRFVYAGNVPGAVGRWENTWCPGCGALLIGRNGYRILENRLSDGACPECARAIPGFWRAPQPVLEPARMGPSQD